jgi:hypothetical protein
LINNVKGAAVRRNARKALAISSGGALDTAPVLREFLKRLALRKKAPHSVVATQRLEVRLEVPITLEVCVIAAIRD